MRFKNFIKKYILRYIDIIECILIFSLFSSSFWGVIISLLLGFIAIRRHWRVAKSKRILKDKLLNERVSANEGAQGSGKTSLMLYMASLEYKANEIFTMVPCKVNGQFTNVLTKEILQLKQKVPLHSCFLLDEMSMYYDNNMNMKDIKNQEIIKPISITFQSIRHFFDGNSIGTSVDMCRVQKQLEEKHSVFNKLLRQEVKINSFIIIPLYKLLLKITKKYDKTKHKYLGTYRIWHLQTFRPITHENYVYDLANQEENKTSNNGFSNILDIWAYNNLDYEYNDTYLRRLYDTLPEANIIKWNSLEIDRQMLSKIGYSDLIKYFPNFEK